MSGRRTTTPRGCSLTMAPTNPGTAPTAHAANPVIRREACVRVQARARSPATPRKTPARPPAPARSRATHTQSTCTSAGDMLESGSDDARQLHRQQGLHEFRVHKQEQLPKQRLHLGLWDMDDRRLDGGRLDALDVDSKQSQHVEWLRDRPRDRDPPGTTAGNDQTVTAPSAGNASTMFYPEQYSLCSPAMRGLAYDWTRNEDGGRRPDPERQHQPADRSRFRLALAGRHRAVHESPQRIQITPTAR